jgi:hypothetical protein
VDSTNCANVDRGRQWTVQTVRMWTGEGSGQYTLCECGQGKAVDSTHCAKEEKGTVTLPEETLLNEEMCWLDCSSSQPSARCNKCVG